MNAEQTAEFLIVLQRIANALDAIEGHLRPAERTTANGKTYTYSIAESLDRIGDEIAER